jgi:hypothetical protein
MSDQPTLCIRCGSKDHSTRDHDEGKHLAGGAPGPPPAAKPRKLASAAPKEKKAAPKYSIVPAKHDVCWNAGGKLPGIPDIIDRPCRTLEYRDPCPDSWNHRDECQCTKCEKRRMRRRTDMARRMGHLK